MSAITVNEFNKATLTQREQFKWMDIAMDIAFQTGEFVIVGAKILVLGLLTYKYL